MEQALEPATLSEKVLHIPPELIVAVAIGVEDPEAIAARFGYEDGDYKALCRYKPFKKQVEYKRQELKESGVTFRMKAAMMAEDILVDVYKHAKSTDAGFGQKMDTLKTLAKYGELEPKTNEAAAAGPGFQISIDLGGGQSVSIGEATKPESTLPAGSDITDATLSEPDELDVLSTLPMFISLNADLAYEGAEYE